MEQQNLPKNEIQATKSRHRSTSRAKEKENQKPTPPPPIKKLGQLEQKVDSYWPAWNSTYEHQKWTGERIGGAFKLPPAKFNAVPSASRAVT